MLQVKKLQITPNNKQQIILGCLCYASAKLWNVANYEKHNYQSLGFEKYPNWYDQKKRLKDNFWYKNLPSQTAQEVLNVLEQGWKSFFALLKAKGIDEPQPPKFKKKNNKYSITYLNKGFVVLDDKTLRLSISKQLKAYLRDKYDIHDDFLILKLKHLHSIEGKIKTIEIKPTKSSHYEIFIVYEIADTVPKELNNNLLSIDIGLKNLFACYDNKGISFIVSGSDFLNTNYYYNKQIAHYQSIAHAHQVKIGAKYGKNTKRITRLYQRKSKRLNHIFHAATKQIIDYCVLHDIRTVVIGDLKNIRKDTNLGNVTNQKLHSLPFAKIYQLLSYKLAKHGISFVKQKESYTSQCSPFAIDVSKKCATPSKRNKRGLYIDNRCLFNADSVGAFNIMRLYKKKSKLDFDIILKGLSSPKRLNVPV